MRGRAAADEADRLALSSPGNPGVVNRQYRRILLTSAEDRMLRDGNREALAVCSRPWLKWMLLAVPLAALSAAPVLFLNGAVEGARALLSGGTALGVFFAAPLLPIYTPPRARVYRVVKWVALIGVFILVVGSYTLKYMWLLASCAWIPVWTEWTRSPIRRKLPVTEWPKHLYL
jgi:hypothetical protein